MNINLKIKYTKIIWSILTLLLAINFSYANHNPKHDFYLDVVNGRLDKVKQYIEQNHNVNDPIRFTDTALIAAADRNQYEIIKYLIAQGADVNLKSKYNRTALYWAMGENGTKIIELLLDNGANVNIAGKDGLTPLSRVHGNYKFKKMKLLIDHGADVNVFNSNGYTPLILAAEDADIDFIKYLLEKGANINTKQRDISKYSVGATPIRAAVKKHRPEVVKLLLNYGADPHIPDNDNITPVQWAKKRGYDDILKLFYDYNVLEPKKSASNK